MKGVLAEKRGRKPEGDGIEREREREESEKGRRVEEGKSGTK